MREYLDKYKKLNFLVSQYNNINDFYDYAIYDKNVKTHPNSEQSSRSIGDANWYGTHSFKETVELTKKGDVHSINEVKKYIDLKYYNTDFKEILDLSDSGGSVPNIDGYLQGLPEDMFEFKNIQNNKFVNVFVNFGTNCGYSAAHRKDAALRILTLIDNLESKNFKCNIYLYNPAELKNGFIYLSIINFKNYKERLDIGLLSFVMLNSSFYRRLHFSACERCGYGIVYDDNGLIRNSGITDIDRLSYCFSGYGRTLSITDRKLPITVDYIKEKVINDNSFGINLNYIDAIKNIGKYCDMVIADYNNQQK
jgi:predicted nucleic-acid-binding Zn-ribbon protein